MLHIDVQATRHELPDVAPIPSTLQLPYTYLSSVTGFCWPIENLQVEADFIREETVVNMMG